MAGVKSGREAPMGKLASLPQKMRYDNPPMQAVRMPKGGGHRKNKKYLKHQGEGDTKLAGIMKTGVKGATSQKLLASKVRSKWDRIRATKWKHGIKAGDSMRYAAPRKK